MGSQVSDSEIGSAIDQIITGFAALQKAGHSPENSRDAITLVREIEQVRRLADHAAVRVLEAIDESRFHLGDGHSSAKSMVRHHARLSNGEAAARERTMKVGRTCPDIADAYSRGAFGTDQIRLLGLIHANPRVRDKMASRQEWFLSKASMRHTDFEQKARMWERITDHDGPTPPNERAHQDRNARMSQNFDTTWEFVANIASMQGLQIFEVFDRYIDAETLADWEKARAEHGDNATQSDLPRTIQQRRADALWQIFIDAAANSNSAMPADFVHDIMWSPETFEAMAEQFFDDETGHETSADDHLDPDTWMCQSIDGIPVDPTEMFANSVVGKIRRVLIDAKSTVIDLGTARRFTGGGRLAVKLSHTRCVWPGCCAPTSRCEIDHLVEHAKHGLTNPDNGAPLCGKHNRWKQKGFTIYRDHHGSWHTVRADGTEIPN